MLNTLISSEIRKKVLKKLLGNPKEKYYVRQLATLLLVSVGSLYKELVKLENEGILKSEHFGTVRLFFANAEHPFYNQIKELISNTATKA